MGRFVSHMQHVAPELPSRRTDTIEADRLGAGTQQKGGSDLAEAPFANRALGAGATGR